LRCRNDQEKAAHALHLVSCWDAQMAGGRNRRHNLKTISPGNIGGTAQPTCRTGYAEPRKSRRVRRTVLDRARKCPIPLRRGRGLRGYAGFPSRANDDREFARGAARSVREANGVEL